MLTTLPTKVIRNKHTTLKECISAIPYLKVKWLYMHTYLNMCVCVYIYILQVSLKWNYYFIIFNWFSLSSTFFSAQISLVKVQLIFLLQQLRHFSVLQEYFIISHYNIHIIFFSPFLSMQWGYLQHL